MSSLVGEQTQELCKVHAQHAGISRYQLELLVRHTSQDDWRSLGHYEMLTFRWQR